MPNILLNGLNIALLCLIVQEKYNHIVIIKELVIHLKIIF